MIDIPQALQAKLDSGVTTLCWVWKLTRQDDQVFCFSDQDQALVFAGMTCQPGLAFDAGELRGEAGFRPTRGAVFGGLDAQLITQTDLDNGVWDRARVEIYRLDWLEPALFYKTFTGELGALKRTQSGFEVELAGLSARLNRTIGRVFSKLCDAELGDARCQVDLSASAYSASVTVTRLISARAFAISGLQAFESGWFTHGVLSWEGGPNAPAHARITQHRREADESVLELDVGPAEPIEIGQDARLVAGCDKSFETCKVKFSNAVQFRGCPHMPGNDVLMRAASSEAIQDGSSRQ